ncbi:glycosyltransferase [Roseomonas xinghualingensis]|uniref:glycosyltransferase n=1 Tax=Roseomonas xinghualingensis TaxID=2986475 RepID=UPI0021F1FF88|nr:glycosyltransferase [Roseomonas sp. SXEYE001]MCV4208672.1 glycosyltransferase [Roseomonas sp. SXEYE001]
MQLRGHIEIFARRGASVHVAGWVRAPKDRLAAGKARLVVSWGEERRELQLRRLRDRSDLPEQGDLPAGYGFQLLMEVPDSREPASAVLLLDGETMPFSPAPLQETLFRPQGHLEAAGRNGVSGWVLSTPAEPPMILLDDQQIPLELNIHRADLPFDDGSEKPLFGFHMPLEALAGALRQSDPGAVLFDERPRELVLLASGVELSRRSVTFQREMIGKLERVVEGEASGWIAEAGRPDDLQAVDLLLDGTRWATVQADILRPDLSRHGIVYGGGGFRIALPRRHPGGGGSLHLAALPHQMAKPLPGAAELENLPAWRKDRQELAFRMPKDGQVPVSVVVPIHNAAAELDRCIASVVRYTTAPARLILMDDASTQPEVTEVLQRWAQVPGVEIHRSPRNLGFTRTANRGIQFAGRDDVVLLNSDTVVGPGWLDGLRIAARSGPRTGTATPVSNNAGAFSVPELNAANPMPHWFGVDDMARLVRGTALSLYPVVPTGHGFCLYLRRDCLDAVGKLDEAAFPRGYGEENDFCMRAARAGFESVLDDRTFVWHQRSASFGEEKVTLNAEGRVVLDERYPEYRMLTRIFETDPTILAVRWRLRRALTQVRAEGSTPRPRLLFVISTESGGTPQTNRDLMDALADRYEPWVLRCNGTVLTLSRHNAAGVEVVEEHSLERPIEPVTHRSTEYDRLAGDLILRHGFELVHIRHIAWHGIGLAETCRRLGIPVIFSFHDFYTLCPVTKLLDAEGRFCAGRCTEGEQDCTPELWPGEAVPPLRRRFAPRWKSMMAEALMACDAFVTTSPTARDTLLNNFPFLADRDFRLIPHGRSFARMETLGAEPVLDEPLRVLVPGNVSDSKGGGLVAAMAALDRGQEVEFHVLGGVDSSLTAAPGIVLHGRYDRSDFAAHVARIRPHLGAILSLWPETYCHTLTECWATGLPVVATALGALAERMDETPGGWLVDRWMAPEEMLALLRRLRRNPTEVRARRNMVLDWQAGIGRHRDAVAMAVEYDRLYREVLDRRRAFRAAPMQTRVILTLDRPGSFLSTPLATATRNAVPRPFIFRPVLPSFPFGDAAVGSADAVLIAPDALPAHDLSALRHHCASVGLPVLEVAAGEASPESGGNEVLFVGHGLEMASWLADGPADMPPQPDSLGPCRVLHALGPDPAVLPALQPIFEHLAALGVATLSVLGEPRQTGSWFIPIGPEPEGAVETLRRTAREHEIGLAPPGPAMLALQAAGLPVLTIPQDLTAEDPDRSRMARDALLRDIAELAADAPRRTALGWDGTQVAKRIIKDHSAGRSFDRQLSKFLDQISPIAQPNPAEAVAVDHAVWRAG